MTVLAFNKLLRLTDMDLALYRVLAAMAFVALPSFGFVNRAMAPSAIDPDWCRWVLAGMCGLFFALSWVRRVARSGMLLLALSCLAAIAGYALWLAAVNRANLPYQIGAIATVLTVTLVLRHIIWVVAFAVACLGVCAAGILNAWYPPDLALTLLVANLACSAVVVSRILVMDRLEESIAARTRAETSLREVAFHDALTSLPNRAYMAEQLGRELDRSRRSGRGLGVLFLDLDDFKRVNDTFGHDVGDRLLVEVADRLRETLRRSDLIARQGGDEFIVALPDSPDLEGPIGASLRILRAFEKPVRLGSVSLPVTPSIGIAMFPDSASDVVELLRQADTAMYAAKQAGGGRYRFYEATLDSANRRRTHLQAKLEAGLGTNEFHLCYQPRVSILPGGEVKAVGVEALMRWTIPGEGPVSPAEFIPVAERSGAIARLGRWGFEQALADWRDYPDVVLSINISPRQFRDRYLARSTIELLSDLAFPASRLEVEITESALMDDERQAVAVLEEFRAGGVRVAMDDFGTGYSALAFLKRFPIEIVKVDRGFVTGLPHDAANVALVRAMIAMTRSMGMHVVAEGVETEEERDFLLAEGCTEMQGYFFARPLPLAEAQAMFSDQATER